MNSGTNTEQLLKEIAALKQQLQIRESAHSDDLRSEIVDSVPVLLAFVDVHLRYVFTNRTYEAWFAIDSESLLGKTVEDVVGPKAYSVIKPQLLRALTGKAFGFETQVPVADGSLRNISANYIPKTNELGEVEGIFVIVTDITDVTRMTRELDRANRVQALGQLTGGVAHDFNNLLAIIQGNADLIAMYADDPQRVQEITGSINRAVENGSAMTSRLLSFARNQDLSPESIDVTAKLNELREVLVISLGEGIHLDIEGCDDAIIDADKAQLENALINLAANARDAMGSGGRLTIAVSQHTIDKAESAHLGNLVPGDYVRISVTDDGEGVDEQTVDKVFDPFFTTKAEGKGTGLGLSMVHGFTKQSGGHLTFKSKKGSGTEVALYFPLARSSMAVAAAATSDDDIMPGQESILVVEDNCDLREIPVSILQGRGYTVEEAMDGYQALEHLRGDTRFDMLFTDILLPGDINGVAVAEQAKALQPGIKVLFTTGFSRDALKEGNIPPQDQHVLSKPYRAGKLLNTIREILDS